MRKLILLTLAAAVGLVGYAAWPLLSAFQIKQAIKAGDVATLERKVHWEPVRASLKASLATLSPKTSATVTTDGEAEMRVQLPPTLWSRVKAAAAPYFADRLIDTYVTAEGVAKLQQMKRSGVLSIFGGAAPAASAATSGSQTDGTPDEGATLPAKFINFYNRIQSAHFHTLTLAEFVIVDRNNPARQFISQFQFSDFDWKLTSVRVVGEGF